MNKQVVVPEGMMKAVVEHHPARGFLEDDPKLYATTTLEAVLEAALRWMSSRSPEISQEQVKRIAASVGTTESQAYDTIDLGVRRMFLAPEPEAAEIDDQLCRDVAYAMEKAGYRPMKFESGGLPRYLTLSEVTEAGRAAIEAYRRGKKSKT